MELRTLDPSLRRLLLGFMAALIAGVSVGLVLVATTTKASISGMVERFNGTPVQDAMEMPEVYPKPLLELLITTHSHVIVFAFIFLAVGLLFYGTHSVGPKWKRFWMTEPFVSIITTFSGMWLMRFVHPSFSYLVFVSSAVLYFSFYLMSAIIIKELLSPAAAPE